MNLDRFNPLAGYLSQNGMEVSDWGIEDTVELSSPTVSSYSQLPPPPSLQHLQYHSFRKSSLQHYGFLSPSSETGTVASEPPRTAHSCAFPVLPTTANFQKYIHKYLRAESMGADFVEQFKYSLIVSDLLDDSMILSKNEQALALLKSDGPNTHKFLRPLAFNGPELHVLRKSYRLDFSTAARNHFLLLKVVCMAIYLLKQDLHEFRVPHISPASRLKMFKILLIMATRLMTYKRVNRKIQSNKLLNSLKDFLVENYRINKKLILHLLSIKELEINRFMNKKSSSDHTLQPRIDTLENALSFLIFNLKFSAVKLLPYLNGEIFEKYCEVNNINLNIIFDTDSDLEDEMDDSNQRLAVQRLTYKMNKFNQLRKFVICQLLSFNEIPHKTFFLCKLWDLFNHEEPADAANVLQDSKLETLNDFFQEHNAAVGNFNMIFDQFEKYHKQTSELGQEPDLNNQNILDLDKFPMHKNAGEALFYDETNITNLISKMSSLTVNLKYFNKYNKSTSNIKNVDELNEKIMIFSQFNDELRAIKELYQVNLSDLQNELYSRTSDKSATNTPTSTPSSSARNSLNDPNGLGLFNLKTFHTSNSIKKRYSLPSHTGITRGSPNTGPALPGSEFNGPSKAATSKASGTGKDRKYKRLSTGLQLGLLTVCEEDDNGNSSSSDKRFSNSSATKSSLGKIAYDDNYINILPPTNYETYNQATLDSLNKRVNFRNSNNRFSMNSIASNVSGISDFLASTQITMDDDDDMGLVNGSESKIGFTEDVLDQGLSKEVLKRKLEESFNKIYNLEHENQHLRMKSNHELGLVAAESEPNKTTTRESTHLEAVVPDKAFLSELERTLESKVENQAGPAAT